jgi:cysteine synthase
VTRTDALGGYQSTRLARVQELLAEHPGAFWPNQYDNPTNPQYHATTTAEELLDLEFDLLVGSISTGGHLCGLAQRLRAERPQTRTVGCDVEGSTILGGDYHPYLVNGVGLSWRPGNTDLNLLDLAYKVSDQAAFSACRILARDCGLLLGGSSGLGVCSALAALEETGATTALVIVADSGNNYLTQLYDDDWLREKGVALLEPVALTRYIGGLQPALRREPVSTLEQV